MQLPPYATAWNVAGHVLDREPADGPLKLRAGPNPLGINEVALWHENADFRRLLGSFVVLAPDGARLN
jgi:hypothetical protein